MEQRTGRVDRIGSLVQRRLDGSDQEPDKRELIQVHYPHLSDTIERLQVRRVLERLNEFLRLIHRAAPGLASQESKVDVAREILRPEEMVPGIEGLLESDFPVSEVWLRGEQEPDDINRPDLRILDSQFDEACSRLSLQLGIDVLRRQAVRTFLGRAAVSQGKIIAWKNRDDHSNYREQPFELVLRAQVAGDATLIRCKSPIGLLDLNNDEVIDELYDLQRKLGMVRVCVRFDLKSRLSDASVEMDRLFHIDTTQHEELVDMVCRTVLAADEIEKSLLKQDSDSTGWMGQADAEGVHAETD